MKAFLLTTLAASSAFAYDGHNSNKKDHNVGIWFFENGREFARGYVFGLEGGKYKKPSQSQCVKDVDSVFYGGEDLYYDVIDLVETNFEDMVSVAQALGGFMIIAPLPDTSHLLLEASSQAGTSGGRKAIRRFK